MSAKQGMSWTVSMAGRRAVKVAVVAGVSGSFLAFYLPNTLYLDKLQSITQSYRKGLPVPVPKCVESLVEEVAGELGLGAAERARITPYTVFGFDLFRAGFTTTTTGALLGIPTAFKYDSEEDFEPSNVLVDNKPVAWSTPEGAALRSSLVFSRDARKFAVARELAALSTWEPLFHAGISSATLTSAYLLSSRINTRWNFYSRPRSLRLALYCLVSMFSYALYVTAKDLSTLHYEAEADRVAGGLGEAYAAGGVEYYTKVLERNVALRKLMGRAGEALYTAYGNDEMLLRTRHIPYTHRRDALNTQLAAYKAGREGESLHSPTPTPPPSPA